MELMIKNHVYVKVRSRDKVDKLKLLFNKFDQKTFAPDTVEFAFRNSSTRIIYFNSVKGCWCTGLPKSDSVKVSIKNLEKIFTMEYIFNRISTNMDTKPPIAEELENKEDLFSRLRKAHAAGAEIQFRPKNTSSGVWNDVSEPSWAPFNEYRIREVMVGDWFKIIRGPGRLEFFKITNSNNGNYGGLKSEDRIKDYLLISRLEESLKP